MQDNHTRQPIPVEHTEAEGALSIHEIDKSIYAATSNPKGIVRVTEASEDVLPLSRNSS